MNAQQLYALLLKKGIVGAKGKTTFSLGGISTTAKDISVIGNLIQDWLEQFMKKNGIQFSKPTNSQDFPDFYLSNSTTKDLLEVKCFTRSPNFDIANFSAYCRSLQTDAYRLDADYLVFKYKSHNGYIEIQDIWLKKVWQISSGSDRSKVRIQWKQNQAFNIRPGLWYSPNTAYPVFKSRKAFVKAIDAVQKTQPIQVAKWLDKVTKNYRASTGKPL
jgi:NgoBV restriction endonuclease